MKKNVNEEKNKKLYNFEDEHKNKKDKKLRNKKKKKRIVKNDNMKKDKGTSENEIIIGVTRYPEKKNKNDINTKEKSNKIKNKKNEVKTSKVDKSKNGNKKVENTNNKKTNKNKNIKKQKNKTKLIKWVLICCILVGGIIAAMLSPLFNIDTITVAGNNKISAAEIISLSEIKSGNNTFKLNKKEIINKIKSNGYIETIEISRKLPNELIIKVEERTATFLIEDGNGYAYVNNQGYILEKTSIKEELPIIIGITTDINNIKEGNRLNQKDLEKLNTVLKIMSVAEINNIEGLITTIDITNEKNYTIFFETEQKTAYLGDCSNLETRMLFLNEILKNESGIAGEIFVNVNINTEKPYFRENV